MEAVLYDTDGTKSNVMPKNGTNFSLEELYELLECELVELIYLNSEDQILIGDEEGRLCDKPSNPIATVVYRSSWGTNNYPPLVGKIIHCPSEMFL